MLARLVYNRITILGAVIVLLAIAAPFCASAPETSQLGMADSIGGVTDVLVGHNNRGPYYLSWTDFSSDVVSVVVNGRMLQKGDYSLDPAKGIITFNSIVANDAIVRVTYQTQPGKSKRATGGTNIPVTLSLRNSASGSLNITGLYAQANNQDPNSARSIIGIGGDRKWGTGTLNSQFLISQSNDPNASKGGVWDRSAMKFGGDTQLGKFKFTGSYLHAGESFAGAKEYGTGVGKDVMSFATSVSPIKSLAADASYTSSEDTTGATKGNHTITNVQNLAYTPIDSTKLSFSHTSNELITAAGARSNNSVTGFQLASTAIKRVTVNSSLVQKSFSDATKNERAFSTGIVAKPIDQVNVEMGFGTLENQAVGQQTSTGVKVSANPIKEVAVQAGYSGVNSSVNGASTATNVAVQATPAPNLQLKASAADSQTVTTKQYQRDISLTGTPAPFAKFMAMFSEKGVNSIDDITRGAQLELTPLKNTRVAAGYRYAETGPQAMTIYDYSAQTKPWEFFSLAGSFRLRDLNTASAPDSSAVSVSLAPAKIVSIVGEYQGSPEDKNGAIQNFNSTSVGLKTKLGSVGVETNYLERKEYLANKLSDEKGLNLALPAFGHGKLTTGCKFGRTLGIADGTGASRTYLLGYQHSVGSDFSLSFTGYYTQYLQTRVAPPSDDEIKAEASFGAKF